jgi:hypothetical protein
MKVRTIDAGVVPFFKGHIEGVKVLPVGDLAHYVKPGDGLMIYTTNDDHVTCRFTYVSLIVATDATAGSIVIDSRNIDFTFNPDRHALSKWKKNPYLSPDKSKVIKYGFREIFADAFSDPSLADAKLEDSVGFAFRPNLSIPTLNPEQGYVYLFRRPDLHKIGKTNNLVRRQNELEREQGVQLELLHSFQTKDMTRAEGTLLAKFRPKLREGAEWFDLDSADVDFILSIEDFGLDS